MENKYNPIVEKPWNSSVRMINFELESILGLNGYDRKSQLGIGFINYNPFIIDSNGEEVFYQREFVWTLEDKQMLIESVYNNIDIGKIITRKRSYKWCLDRKDKDVAYRDIVDGKQRLSTLLDFVSNKFPDKKGYYFKDFSILAKSKFMSFSSLGYGEIGENASDQDVIEVFLSVNIKGVPVSTEHIDFVKNIKL